MEIGLWKVGYIVFLGDLPKINCRLTKLNASVLNGFLVKFRAGQYIISPPKFIYESSAERKRSGYTAVA